MGRKSKLSERQWEQLEKRLLAGEQASKLAKEFGVSPATISLRFSKSTKTVKTVANQLVEADAALRALPISQQLMVVSLADDLRAMSTHLAGAGKYGAATAHRLSGIAHAKVQEIDDATPLDGESIESLKGVAVLTKLANDASTIALNLLAANKDAVKEMHQRERPKPQRVTVEVIDASAPDAEA